MTIQIYWQQKSHASKVDEKKKKSSLAVVYIRGCIHIYTQTYFYSRYLFRYLSFLFAQELVVSGNDLSSPIHVT